MERIKQENTGWSYFKRYFDRGPLEKESEREKGSKYQIIEGLEWMFRFMQGNDTPDERAFGVTFLKAYGNK